MSGSVFWIPVILYEPRNMIGILKRESSVCLAAKVNERVTASLKFYISNFFWSFNLHSIGDTSQLMSFWFLFVWNLVDLGNRGPNTVVCSKQWRFFTI